MDQDAHRFLWDGHIVVRRMMFGRLPFGNKSSPFVLNATSIHLLSQYPHSRVIEELSETMYMDDWPSGCDDDADGCAMLSEADEVMDLAGIVLNSEQLDELLCREFKDKSVGEDSFKVLGIRWLANQDCFSCDGVKMPRDLCVTKRLVLSIIWRLFDPLGFITPFITVAKCLFQEFWRLGVVWDEVVPVNVQYRFTQWVKSL